MTDSEVDIFSTATNCPERIREEKPSDELNQKCSSNETNFDVQMDQKHKAADEEGTEILCKLH